MVDSPKVGILVVSYRNNPELLAFLQHLSEFPKDHIDHVVATANGLDDKEVTTLSTGAFNLMPGRLRLIAGPQNPGYFGGAALGWRDLQSLGSVPDWIIVTNDDVRFAPDFFLNLAKAPVDNTAVLAPDIVVPANGIHQNPLYARKPPAHRLRLLLWLHSHPAIMRAFMGFRSIRQRLSMMRVNTSPPLRHAIYAPHGACIVFSRQYFQRGGSLDYPGFLYGEEFFVAETGRQLDLVVYMEPTLRVAHMEHASTGLLAPAAMAGYVRNSLALILSKYYSE
jgi:GT2 family glycosyltransferase